MDRLEKTDDAMTALLMASDSIRALVWTALPGVIQDFDPVKMTCSVQPAIQARVQDEQSEYSWVSLPLLVDCPVVFPSGGGALLSFPLAVGDECLVVFASRCIDNWWLAGAANGAQTQAEIRMHDLSDGFVLPGPYSQPRVPSVPVNTGRVELRLADNTARVSITVANKKVEVATTGDASVTANRIDLNGELYINGQAYVDHVHTGVTPGGSNTAGVAT